MVFLSTNFVGSMKYESKPNDGRYILSSNSLVIFQSAAKMNIVLKI